MGKLASLGYFLGRPWPVSFLSLLSNISKNFASVAVYTRDLGDNSVKAKYIGEGQVK